MSANIVGSIRLAEMINNFWNSRAEKQINEVIAEAERILESDYYFGYLVKTDKMGYLRALSKTKYTFRGLNRDDVTDGMVTEEGVNPLFVEMIEDFYYSEIRKNAKIYDLKLARYNALRDDLIERFEGDKSTYTELGQIEFGITREEMFDKVRNNELIWVLAKQNNTWYPVPYERYERAIKKNLADEIYPLSA